MADEISCVVTHPHKTLVAMTCYNGSLQVWDYDMKLLMNLREFNSKENHTATVRTSITKRLIEPK
jgi:hypothetical protein